ncbi:unnamed protein product [Parascedosporium putredinis]|uniref:Triacylglycerol lipase N-terminal domain-containing protein n=1 Tax=Parascedosporium putredinis TaxID=1442378 RepID=A0A9P1MCG7_9PEZI|nr:unnamed protein product [Parascedosporium putredinis]CAI8001542.1 unnamed protein product [Parascedosporium putredinis]
MSGRRNSFFQSSATKYGFAPEAFDPGSVPGIADDFSDPEGIEAFANALQAPEFHSAADELSSPSSASFTTIRSPRLISEDPHDETNTLASASGNADWVIAAKELDSFLGRQDWKEENEYAYYDSKTIRRVWDHMRKLRHKAESLEKSKNNETGKAKPVEELRVLAEACIKSNFVGVEGPRLYSQTYYGTKNLVQNYIDESEKTIKFLMNTKQLPNDERRVLFKHMHANFGRTALCLSGGATFAYYHFGVVRALLDADLCQR